MLRFTPYPAVPPNPRGLARFSNRAEKDLVDKRKAWREQEQQLIEMWNSAARRYRDIVSLGGSDVESISKAAAVRAEIEALRKKVARLKSEFNSGKRY